MTGINHRAGGLTFTATFASFFEVNILSRWEFIAFTIVFSVLPDIDHNKSLIGKVFRPISGYLSTRYGHRTITHSLVFYLSVVFLVASLDKLLRPDFTYTLIAALALASHLIFDMCTVQGIPLMYPFSKRPWVLPGNPNLRLSSSNIKAEAVIFMGFCGLFFVNQPLFANGFWSQYNRVFLDFEHIAREASEAGDVLEVEFSEKGKFAEKGFLVGVSGSKMILFSGQDFRQIEKEGTEFKNFRHTGRKPRTEQIGVFGVSADSLKHWLRQPVVAAQIQSNAELRYYEGSILKSGTAIIFEYRTGFDFTMDTPDLSAEKMELEKYEAQMAEKMTKYRMELLDLEQKKSRLNAIAALYSEATDYEKGKLIDERKVLESQIVSFKTLKPDLSAEQVQIEFLRRKLIHEKPSLNANIQLWKF